MGWRIKKPSPLLIHTHKKRKQNNNKNNLRQILNAFELPWLQGLDDDAGFYVYFHMVKPFPIVEPIRKKETFCLVSYWPSMASNKRQQQFRNILKTDFKCSCPTVASGFE